MRVLKSAAAIENRAT